MKWLKKQQVHRGGAHEEVLVLFCADFGDIIFSQFGTSDKARGFDNHGCWTAARSTIPIIRGADEFRTSEIYRPRTHITFTIGKCH